MGAAFSARNLFAMTATLSLFACGGAAATAPPILTTAPVSTATPEMPTPTSGADSGPPETTPVVVWPSLSKIEPSEAAPGEEVAVEGLGGLTKLRPPTGG